MFFFSLISFLSLFEDPKKYFESFLSWARMLWMRDLWHVVVLDLSRSSSIELYAPVYHHSRKYSANTGPYFHLFFKLHFISCRESVQSLQSFCFVLKCLIDYCLWSYDVTLGTLSRIFTRCLPEAWSYCSTETMNIWTIDIRYGCKKIWCGAVH